MMNVERKTTMSQFLIASSVWLHALATVVFIGHFLLLALIYMPVLTLAPGASAGVKDKPDVTAGMILAEISKRSRRWLYTALLIFLITGVYLTFVGPNYLGIGNFLNPWAILMLIKHLLIVGMIAAGFWFNAIMRVGPMLSSKTGAEQAFNRFRLYVNSMAITGVLVLLLTAFSQAQ
jgi:uncharacterized membrane protein